MKKLIIIIPVILISLAVLCFSYYKNEIPKIGTSSSAEAAKTTEANNDYETNLRMQKELLSAVESGNLAKVENVLKKGIPIDIVTSGDEDTALIRAVVLNNRDMIKFLLKNGADINAFAFANKKGTSALNIAIIKGDKNLVEFLLNSGAELRDAIAIAVIEGNMEMVSFLLSRKADVNIGQQTGWWYEPTPLQLSAEAGNFDMVRFLLKNGADINKVCDSTIVASAAKSGNLELVEYLLSQGGKADGALTVAFAEGYKDVARFLLKNKTPLGNAIFGAVSANDIESVKLLISLGADVDAGEYGEEGYNCSALSIAASNGNLEMVNLLCSHGADVDSEEGAHDEQKKAIVSAYENGHFTIVDYLLSKNADYEQLLQVAQDKQDRIMLAKLEIVKQRRNKTQR